MSILLKNRVSKFKIKTKDSHLLHIFSVFYDHPAMLNEEGWVMMKGMKILVDVDTMFLLESNISEFGWNKDKLLTCKITSNLEGEELNKHWDKLYKHATRVRSRMKRHFDSDKVVEMLEDLSISHSSPVEKDSTESDPKPENTPAKLN